MEVGSLDCMLHRSSLVGRSRMFSSPKLSVALRLKKYEELPEWRLRRIRRCFVVLVFGAGRLPNLVGDISTSRVAVTSGVANVQAGGLRRVVAVAHVLSQESARCSSQLCGSARLATFSQNAPECSATGAGGR